MSASQKLAWLVLAIALIEACSGKPKARAPGELASVPDRYVRVAQISAQGNTLYYTYGETAYAVDVSDPRRPRQLSSSATASGLLCNGEAGCSGFAIVGGDAYFADDNNIAKVALPSATFPAWLYGLPAVPPDHYTNTMVSISNGGLAIGGTRQNTVDTVPGDLLLVSTSDGLPSLASTVIDTSSAVTFVSSDGPWLFYLAASDMIGHPPPVPYHRIVVLNTHAQSAPIEVSRVDVPSLPVGDDVYFMDARGHDLVIGALRSPLFSGGDEIQFTWLAWYRFSADFASLGFVDAAPRWVLANPPLVLSGGRLFFAVYGTDANPFDLAAPARIVVMRLDTAKGLVEESITPLDVFPRQIAVDEQRGLVYVGGYGLEIFDLGVLEGGPPRWP